jgi:phosphoribosylaminoimidazole (AIR) synthetase
MRVRAELLLRFSALEASLKPILICCRGGFGGEVDLNKAGYAHGPVIVGAIDGVGERNFFFLAPSEQSSFGWRIFRLILLALSYNQVLICN